jgi:hypothetical protein
VVIDGKRCWYERRSGTVPTPAEEFLEQQKQAGDNILSATYKLLHSDVPLARRDRKAIAFMLALMATSKGKKSEPRVWKEVRRKIELDLRRDRLKRLKERGIIGLQAEEIIAAEEGVSVEALRKRTQRAK